MRDVVVDDVKVGERLREASHPFSLPHMMPGAIPVPKPEGFEAITINADRGRLRVLARRLRFSSEHEILHAGLREGASGSALAALLE